MKKAFLAFLLLAVPLLVVPFAVTFDAAKAALLACGVAVVAAWALPPRTESGRGRLDLRWSPVTVALAAAWLAMAASAHRGPDPYAAARLLALLLAALVFAMAVENAAFTAGDLLPLAGAATAATALAAAYGLIQAAGFDFPFPWRDSGRALPVSTLGNPNFAAEWVAASLPVCLLLARKGRRIAWVAVVLGALFLLAARGRGALLGLAVGGTAAAALALATGEGRRRAAGLALAALLVAGLGTGAAWTLSRGGEMPGWLGRSDTVIVRADLARGSARMLLDHPLGVGAGNWEAAHPPYRTEREYRASLFRDPGEAHGDPLQFAAEGGWPMAAAILAAAVLLVLAAARAASRGEDRGLALALFASLATTVGASLVSAPFHRPASLLLAAFAAGGLASLGGGRTTTLGFVGASLHRLLVLLLGGGAILLGVHMAAEGAQSDGRRIERESDPLPWERAVEARDLFARAVALDPGAADAWARGGEISLKLGATASTAARAKDEFLRAKGAYDALLRLRPSDPMALSNRAEVLARLGDGAGAEAEWRRALAVAPFHRNGNQALASFLVGKGRAAEALPLAERALSLDPRWPPAVAARVEALSALGRDGEARIAAAQGIDGILAAGDPVGAGVAARRCAATDLAMAAMLCGKGARLLEAGRVAEGRAVLEGVLSARPDDEDLLERGAQAFTAAKLAPEASLLRVEARFAAAGKALAAGDRERAAAEVRRGLEVPVPTAEMRVNRVRAAALFTRAGKREEALGALAVAVDRGFADAAAVEADPAFAPLKGDPTFRKLLRSARGHAQK